MKGKRGRDGAAFEGRDGDWRPTDEGQRRLANYSPVSYSPRELTVAAGRWLHRVCTYGM
jgi:hypothetical protein